MSLGVAFEGIKPQPLLTPSLLYAWVQSCELSAYCAADAAVPATCCHASAVQSNSLES